MANESTRALFDAFHAALDGQSNRQPNVDAVLLAVAIKLEEGDASPNLLAQFDTVRDAVMQLIDASRDVNHWLCRTEREHTAHQKHLLAAIVRCGVLP